MHAEDWDVVQRRCSTTRQAAASHQKGEEAPALHGEVLLPGEHPSKGLLNAVFDSESERGFSPKGRAGQLRMSAFLDKRVLAQPSPGGMAVSAPIFLIMASR